MNLRRVQSTKSIQTRRTILRLFLWTLGLVSTGLFLIRVFTAIPFSTANRLFDFGWYDYAFKVVWNHMPSAFLYQRQTELQWMQQYLQGTPWHLNGGSQFLYPPQFAVLFSFIAAFPIHAANVIWDTLLTLSYLGAVSLLLLMIRSNSNHNKASRSLILLLASISLLWYPFQRDIYWGNSDSLLFLLVIGTFYLKDYRQRPLLAGILLGLAVLFKITPMLLVLFFIIRDLRTSVSAFVTIVVGTVIASFAVGWKIIIYYIFHFSMMAHRSAVLNGNGGTAPWNSSIKGVLELARHSGLSWITPTLIDAVFGLFVLVVLVLLSLRVFSRFTYSEKAPIQIGSYILSLLLLSPVIENHYIVLALAPYLFAVSQLANNWAILSRSKRSLAFLSLLLAFALINPIGAPMVRFYTNSVPIHYFLGIVIIAVFQFFPIKLQLHFYEQADS